MGYDGNRKRMDVKEEYRLLEDVIRMKVSMQHPCIRSVCMMTHLKFCLHRTPSVYST